MSDDSLKIISLEVENVKRISAAYIEPNGEPVIIIGGRNKQGKTSLLDAIWMALRGKNAVCPKPVKVGEDRGHVTLDLGTYVVCRTFSADGRTSLEVRSQDGAKFSSPQALLDKVVGDLSFDPLAFSRKKAAAQVEVLTALTGLDFTEADSERQRAYEERTHVNRDVKTLEAKLRGMPTHDDAPAEEVSVANLVEEMERARKAMDVEAAEAARIEEHASEALRASDNARVLGEQLERAEAEVKRLADDIERWQADSRACNQKRREAQSALEACRILNPIPDTAKIRARMAGAEATNAKVRDNAALATATGTLATRKAEADALTEAIEAIDASKREQIEDTELPVPGIGFGAAGVTLEGIPFEQCSSAEQIRASVAIGVAMNPRLKVMLIRDGSLLDEQSRELVRQQAEAADAQFWMEVVGNSGDVSVLIEDGAIVGQYRAAE